MRPSVKGEDCGYPGSMDLLHSNGGGRPFKKFLPTKGNSRGKPGSTELLHGRGLHTRKNQRGEHLGKPSLKKPIPSHGNDVSCEMRSDTTTDREFPKSATLEDKVSFFKSRDLWV